MDASPSTADHLPQTRSERVVVWQRCALAEDEDGALALAWSREVITQVQVHGGEPLAILGSTVVFSFDAIDYDEALELALTLLRLAQTHASQPRVSYGIAIGTLTTRALIGGQAVEGSALDRAQVLSGAAEEADIIVDETAHERLSEHYLFGKEVTAGMVRGRVLDKDLPRKRSCRMAVLRLQQAPIPTSRRDIYEQLRLHATGERERCVLLRTSQPCEALDFLSRLAKEVSPPFELHLRAQASGLQPLGSLQAALTHGPSQSKLEQALSSLPLDEQQVLRALVMGEAISRSDAVGAITTLLDRNGPAPWVVLHRLHDIDAASLGVLSECRKRLAKPPLIFTVLPETTQAPTVLFPEDDRCEVVFEPLAVEERRAMAAAIVGLPADSSIAQRITLLADATPLGITEGCRTLVAAGDLVDGEQGFHWRTGPRQAQAAIPTDTLIGERVAGAPPLAYRMLEVLAVMPPSGGKDLSLRIAELDGASTADAEQGLSLLQEEGFIGTELDLGDCESALRNAILALLPAPRYAELQRFVARALVQGGSVVQVTRGYGRALFAHHQAEGGLVQEAASALLDGADEALRGGFQRMAVHLAATAIDLDPSGDVRSRAQTMMASLERGRKDSLRAGRNGGETPSVPPPPPGTAISSHAVNQAIASLRSGDLDAVGRHLDAATAAGGNRDATRRLRAMLLLQQQESERAMQALKQATGSDLPPGEDPRDAVALALIKLKESDIPGAVRSALSALAISRAQRDKRGEQASLLVLSGCYTLAGDDIAAKRLQEAAYAAVPSAS